MCAVCEQGARRWQAATHSAPKPSVIPLRSSFRFSIERAFATPLPQRQHVAGIIAARASGEIEQRAVKRGAIVVGQLNQPGFLDQPTQLYQMTCSFAALHDPGPAIGSPLRRFRP